MVRHALGWLLVMAIGLGCLPDASWAKTSDRRLFLTPMAGIWQWDPGGLEGGEFENEWSMAYGLRAGFQFHPSIAVEGIVLRGKNTVMDADSGSEDLGLLQTELSGLVSLKGLGSDRVYPTVSLGLGYSWHSGSAEVGGQAVGWSDHVSFHLGAGVMGRLTERVALRLTIRDTFYYNEEKKDNDVSSTIVDMVEISGGFQVEFPLGRSASRRKLR